MVTKKDILLAAAAIGAVSLVASVVVRHMGSTKLATADSVPAQVNPPQASAFPPPRPRAVVAPPVADLELPAKVEQTPTTSPAPSVAPRNSTGKHATGVAGNVSVQTPAVGQPVPKDVARLALSFVGVDPAAEDVWAQAINDPMLSANDRKDLIEDLNEHGFPDPTNITADDLPLIVSRMQLIEAMAPDAMDDTNAAAFAEAYKDLTNMFSRLTKRG